MKFKYVTNATYETAKPQEFDECEPEYKLNTATNHVEPTGGKINRQAEIQSGLTSCLSEMMNAFLVDEKAEPSPTVEVQRFNLGSDLDRLTELSMQVSDMAQAYGLPPESSLEQVVKYAKGRFDTLDGVIKDAAAKFEAAEAAKNNNKEVPNAKSEKVEPPSE